MHNFLLLRLYLANTSFQLMTEKWATDAEVREKPERQQLCYLSCKAYAPNTQAVLVVGITSNALNPSPSNYFVN